jgi:hypothetical protein
MIFRKCMDKAGIAILHALSLHPAMKMLTIRKNWQ